MTELGPSLCLPSTSCVTSGKSLFVLLVFSSVLGTPTSRAAHWASRDHHHSKATAWVLRLHPPTQRADQTLTPGPQADRKWPVTPPGQCALTAKGPGRQSGGTQREKGSTLAILVGGPQRAKEAKKTPFLQTPGESKDCSDERADDKQQLNPRLWSQGPLPRNRGPGRFLAPRTSA